jgi:hypothetical protein
MFERLGIYEYTFSATAEWAVASLLAIAVVISVFA